MKKFSFLFCLLLSISTFSHVETGHALTAMDCKDMVDQQMLAQYGNENSYSSGYTKNTIRLYESYCYPAASDTLETCEARVEDYRNVFVRLLGSSTMMDGFIDELKHNCVDKFAEHQNSINQFKQAYIDNFHKLLSNLFEIEKDYYDQNVSILNQLNLTFDTDLSKVPELTKSIILTKSTAYLLKADDIFAIYKQSVQESIDTIDIQYNNLINEGVFTEDSLYIQTKEYFNVNINAINSQKEFIKSEITRKKDIYLDLVTSEDIVPQPELETVVPQAVNDTEVINDYFSDINGSTKYVDSIMYLKVNNIISGYPDGTFGPLNNLNRAEFAKILVLAKFGNISEEFDQNCFTDIEKGQWFSKYVCFAKSKGIIQGYPDGKFKPENNVNYVEALKMALETYNFKPSFVSELWYTPYLDIADSYLFSLDSIAPERLLTRAEIAEILARIVKYNNNL